jgi:hypothetical protein
VLSPQRMQHPGSFLHATSCDGSETRQDPTDSRRLNAGARYVLAPHYFGPGRPMAGSACLPFVCNVLIRFERVAVVATVGGQRSALLLTRELVAWIVDDNSKTCCGGLLQERTASVPCHRLRLIRAAFPRRVEVLSTSLLRRPKYFLIPLYSTISTPRPSPFSNSKTNDQPLTACQPPVEPIFRNANLHARLLSAAALTLVPHFGSSRPLPLRRLALLPPEGLRHRIRTSTRSSKSTPALALYLDSPCPIPPFPPSNPATLRATTTVPLPLRPTPPLPLRHP